MRIWKTALLLASAASAMPVLAQEQPQQAPQQAGQWHRGGERGDGGQAPRAQGQPGQQRGDGRGPGYQQQRPPQQAQAPGQPGGGEQARGEPGRGQGGGGGRPGQPGGGWQQGGPGRGGPGGGDQGRGDPGRGDGGRGYAPQSGQDGGRRFEGRPDNGVQVWRGRPGGGDDRGGRNGGNDGYRPDNGRGQGYGGRPGGYDRGGDRGGNWNRGWRDDRRYDWQGWRSSHRSVYRTGRYYAPQGYAYGYRRFGIGAVISPAFFAQNYWIGDPGYYRLPPAYEPYRWVRYYNDALLVDVYTGQVVDTIPDFFY